VTLKPTGDAVSTTTTAVAGADGGWIATMPTLAAVASATLEATAPGSASATLHDVAVGDVLLCGGQSNMGFGMCGSKSKTQTPQQALDALPPIRFYFQAGSGPNGGAGSVHCKTTTNESSITPAFEWHTANATNAGGFSANCMLTAADLYKSLGGSIPVGAVESCIGGTNVEPWTPPTGSLYIQHIVPLLPMTFKLALWDQGEADAKRTNSTWCTPSQLRIIVVIAVRTLS
jgi:sialate O-acetylesterase